MLEFLKLLLSPSARFEKLARDRLVHEYRLSQAEAASVATEACEILNRAADARHSAFIAAYPGSAMHGFLPCLDTSYLRPWPDAEAHYRDESQTINEREKRELTELAERARRAGGIIT